MVDKGHNVIDKFSAAGVYEGQLIAGEGGSPLVGLRGVAVAPSGVVWVSQVSPGAPGGQATVESFSDALVNVFLSREGGGK